ncbi:MAG: hypothetical protein J1E57_08385 [Prevotella sp.]|nr:hypothetical protein [Prevotella sp.]
MRKTAITAIVALAAMTFTNCGNKAQQEVAMDSDTIEVEDLTPVTLFGVCADGTSMNTLQLITDTNDTLSLSIAQAMEDNNVFGGLLAGDRMSVLVTPDKKAAMTVVNTSTLLGQWEMPNPLDGSDMVGIDMKDGGVAESIEQSTINYKTWRVRDGKLEITLVREGGSEEEETEIYNFLMLNNDSLVYANAEDTLSYSRKR